MVDTRTIQRASVQSCLGAGLIMALAGCVSANPIISPPTSTPVSGVYDLFLANLPVDVLLFSVLFLLVFWKMKSPLRTTPEAANTLVAQVALGGVIIAAIGALIDFYSFFTYYEWDGGTHGGYYPVYLMTASRLAVAGTGVFVSVCAVALFITRLRLIPSLVQGAAITGFNLFAWVMWDYGALVEDGRDIVILAGVVFLFVPPIMFGIAHLHGSKGVRS